MAGKDPRDHVAEVRGDGEVAAFVKGLRPKAEATSVDLPSAHAPAQDEKRTPVAVIGSAVPVLPGRPSELRHREKDDVVELASEVLRERGNPGGKVRKARGKLADRAALVHMRVPSAGIGEASDESQIRFDDRCHFPHGLAEGRPGIIRVTCEGKRGEIEPAKPVEEAEGVVAFSGR